MLFSKEHYVKFHLEVFLATGNFKIEPMSMSFCIKINPHKYIKFILSSLKDQV